MKKLKALFAKLDTYFFLRFNKKKGYSKYYAGFYRKELKAAYKNAQLPRKERKWAYKRGFNPWRIRQYGLTEENYQRVISDRDYFYLYPINNSYRSLIDNKLTTKYVLAPFDRFMPKYYFHVMKDRGVMRLMDCPEELSGGAESVIKLLEQTGRLAAKQAAGTYGIGFYKLEYDGGAYYANGKRYEKDAFAKFIAGLNDYIITEYVVMHPELAKINPHAVNTVRVTLINEHGDDPMIPFAFLRIGTKKSGAVDNVAQGGMVCKVDVKTGRFYEGQVLVDHIYADAPTHPDSGVLLDGFLPNWDLVISQLLAISRYLPQLKWLGFDIAITEDGFQIIEINSHQGLHKAHEYPEEVSGFLFRELAAKKKKYGVK